jgi:hypothetical protein
MERGPFVAARALERGFLFLVRGEREFAVSANLRSARICGQREFADSANFRKFNRSAAGGVVTRIDATDYAQLTNPNDPRTRPRAESTTSSLNQRREPPRRPPPRLTYPVINIIGRSGMISQVHFVTFTHYISDNQRRKALAARAAASPPRSNTRRRPSAWPRATGRRITRTRPRTTKPPP